MVHPTASLLTLALTILNYGTSMVTAQVISQIAPYKIDRTDWIVSADSESTLSGNYISNAFDDNPDTFWHSEWYPYLAPLPHQVVIDMNNQYLVNGFSYTPRQDGVSNGNIGAHVIETSLDNQTWTSAAQGTWVDDATVKTTLFTPVIARYVRITATTEAQGEGYQWSSAAEFYVLSSPHSTLTRENWVVYVDSQQLSPESYAGTYAIDGSPNTYWQTEYLQAQPALPHYYIIDQGVATTVGGLSYLPRLEATGSNGHIGEYEIQYSLTGEYWTTVTTGTWPDTPYIKFSEWTPITARWWCLIAITEAGNRGPWSSAAEINLLDGSTQLADFIITVDSQETALANNSALEGIDGDVTTFWHSQWSSNPPAPLPHYYEIDMRIQMPVKALQYTPRQDGGVNGNIGQHVIDVSTDGNTWTTVATGAFSDNQDVKLVYFEETIARYVRLTATTEAGNRGPWSSAAEITLSFDTSYVAPAPQTSGQWDLTIDFPMVPVAVGLIYNTGGLVAWSSWNPTGDGFSNTPGGQTLTATYDPVNGEVSKVMVTNTDHDMFCPGISMDFNGRIIVTGGDDAQRASVYDPTQAAWLTAHDMNVARGYQAQTTLSNGAIFTIGGSWSGGIFIKNGEYYVPSEDTWTSVNGAEVTPMLTNDAQGLYRADNHGWLFAWKDASIFQAGPSAAMNWYTINGNGSVTSAGPRSNSGDAMCGNAVMYDAANGKILTMGGAPSYQSANSVPNVYLITIGDPGTQPEVQQLTSMTYPRIFSNGIALPNGQVFVVGGQEYGVPFEDDSAVMYPELWDPTTQLWTIMAPMSVPRNYHSTALLMPDARVFVGGGGLCDGCQNNHFDGQIWSPPYLFTSSGALAERPSIFEMSTTTIPIGGTITVNVNGGPITSFALMRMGTTTHTVNTDQRRIDLPITANIGTAYNVLIPSDAGIALPGFWMLFAINENGVPSISETIMVTL